MTVPRAGLIEVLVPTLDELCADLVVMHGQTAIDLHEWPAALAFVQSWAPHTTPLLEDPEPIAQEATR